MIDNLMQSVFRSPQPILLISLGLAILGGGVIIVAGFQIINHRSSSSIEVLSEVEGTKPSQNSSTIFVDINGAVVTPGIFELPADARVTDVVQMAGGFTDQADADFISKQLNLSQMLSDGQKIYIPLFNSTAPPNSSMQTSSSWDDSQNAVNINTATLTQLQTLDGVGEVRAQLIITNRPYQSLEELIEKKVLPQSVVEKNKNILSL